MALALYRKHRPGSLSDVIGQEHITGPLGRALLSGKVHHAYLFSGPRGCGKTSTARILARSLNCREGPTPQPCGQCQSCVDLAPNGPGSVDVIEMDAATNRGIDDARDLRERAVYAPAMSAHRVYIIDEAHQLTNEAANALLKVVEEPPPHLRFIFATTEPDRIIPTIRSRTFHYSFRLVPSRVLVEHLARVCAEEGVTAQPDALKVVARVGAGSVRDSLSVLGQLLAGAGPDGLTMDDAVAALGLTQASVLDDFVNALSSRSAAQMFAIVEHVISSGHDPRRFATDALDRIRDLMIISADPSAVASGIVEVSPDAVERLLAQAKSLGLEELSRAADVLSSGLTSLRGATSPRLQLELLCARLALPTSSTDVASLAARVAALERSTQLRPGVAAKPAPAAAAGTPLEPSAVGMEPAGEAPAAGTDARGSSRSVPRPPPRRRGPSERATTSDAVESPARATEAPVPAPEAGVELGRGQAAGGGARQQTDTEGLGRLRGSWEAILAALETRTARTLFHSSSPLSLDEDDLSVAVRGSGHVPAIINSGHDERLRQAILDVLAMDLRITVVAEGGGAAEIPSAGSGQREPTRPTPPRQRRDSPGTGAPGPKPGSGQSSGAGRRDTSRAQMVRDAARSPVDEPDEPSPDDPDEPSSVDDGMALIARELGARPIGEIDHS